MTNNTPRLPFLCRVLHPTGSPTGLRVIESETSPLVLLAAPRSELSALLERDETRSAVAYLLVGKTEAGDDIRRVYVGETFDPRDRIQRHRIDIKKQFFSEIFVITKSGEPFGKDRILQLQWAITKVAESVGHVEIVKGTNPVAPRLSESDKAVIDRLFEDLRCLLVSAGCRILEPAPRDHGTAGADAQKPAPQHGQSRQGDGNGKATNGRPVTDTRAA